MAPTLHGPFTATIAGLAVALAVVVLLSPSAPLGGASNPHPGSGPRAKVASLHGPPSGSGLTLRASPVAANGSNLSLSISASPTSICATTSASCDGFQPTARVTLTAQAPSAPTAWPKVQVVFAIDATFFNGVYTATDDPGYNLCDLRPPNIPCEEANTLPLFAADAGKIAESIAQENPYSQTTFALAHFASTLCDYGDCDGPVYHVDVGAFVPANEFGAAEQSSFQATYLGGGYSCADCDFWDNFLHAPSITALYGILTGAGIDWAPDAHHVVIVIGDTAPRDRQYVQNYCVSGWDGGLSGGSCYSSPCEPAYVFSNGREPACEGWATSSDGNPQDSIAWLARNSPSCAQSLGGSCTIDAIDAWATPTDPYSLDWPAQFAGIGGAPGGIMVKQNVFRVLEAGCDIARATGGSWDGPAWFACPGGASGTLQYEVHGNPEEPNLVNPTFLAALRIASFGPLAQSVAAYGGSRPMFEFTPFGAIQPAPLLNAAVACIHNGLPSPGCQVTPTVTTRGEALSLGWNWSTTSSQNQMSVGDTWEAQFDIMATGPPYTFVPVDACITIPCLMAQSGSVNGFYTEASYSTSLTGPAVAQSFPLAEIRVVSVALTTVPTVPPPAPPPPGIAFPIAIGPQIPVAQPLPIALQSLLGGLSVNATAVGLIAAGMTRMAVKHRAVALRVASKSGLSRSQLEPIPRSEGPTLPEHWE
ncbi:MAG TPA: hypothetical protein VFG07_09430 [Thermoplasmata archaeon]|nr:hypothetical protein [Thermoplasmata archaeon]